MTRLVNYPKRQMAKQGVKKIGRLPIEDITPRMVSREKNKTMAVIGEESVNHFVKGFREGGGQTDESKDGWERRRSGIDPGRAILVKSGDLWQDIDVIRETPSVVVVGTQRIGYAAEHNEGLLGQEQREFIGPSQDLEKTIEKEVASYLDVLTKGTRR